MAIEALLTNDLQKYTDWDFEDMPEKFQPKSGMSSLDEFLEEFAREVWFAGCASGAQTAVEQAERELAVDAGFVDDYFMNLSLWEDGLVAQFRIEDIIKQAASYAEKRLSEEDTRPLIVGMLRREADILQGKIGPDPDELLGP